MRLTVIILVENGTAEDRAEIRIDRHGVDYEDMFDMAERAAMIELSSLKDRIIS